MTLTAFHLVGILFLFMLHWWVIWLLIRQQSVVTTTPTGPFYVIILPTMRGILHGYYTSILSGHTTLVDAEHAAIEAREDDHSGMLGSHYHIVLYDAMRDDTYCEYVPE